MGGVDGWRRRRGWSGRCRAYAGRRLASRPSATAPAPRSRASPRPPPCAPTGPRGFSARGGRC